MSTSGGVPTAAAPSGPAGGDLSGTYPNPGVAKIQGTAVSATPPTAGQFLLLTSGVWVPTSFAAPSLTLGTANAAGATGNTFDAGSTIAAFDATAPVTQAFGDVAATGAAAVASRRDHKHGMPANPVTAANIEATFTAAGQLYVGTGSGTGSLLGIGTANQVLSVNAGATALVWTTPASAGVTSFNGGTGAISQTNGYGIAGANSNPPVPAVSLTNVSGNLPSDVTLTGSATTTIMSTSSLAIGTWRLRFGVTILDGTTGGLVEVEMFLGTATATFSGQQSTETQSGANVPISVAIECIVTVTVAGTISFRATVASAVAATAKASTTGAGAYPNATGYVATRTA